MPMSDSNHSREENERKLTLPIRKKDENGMEEPLRLALTHVGSSFLLTLSQQE